MLMDDERLSVVTEETDSVTIDDAIDEVEDAIDDIISGTTIDDGHLIDNTALTKRVDKDVIHLADREDDDDDLITSVMHGNDDPDDIAYSKEYPRLHDEDCDDEDDLADSEDEDIDEEDLCAVSIDEGCYVRMRDVNTIMEALIENDEEED